MRILIITDYYQPDGGPAAPLYSMLCEALVRRGHQIEVVTSVPHYPSGKVPKSYQGKWFSSSEENGVRIVRVGLPSIDRNWLGGRLLQFTVFQLLATYASLGKSYDVFLTHSPALETWIPFFYHNAMRRKPAIYSVHDVYPEVGIRLGIFKNRLIISVVESLEKFCLQRSRKVRILSKTFARSLTEMGVPAEHICLIYDWVDTHKIVEKERDNTFAREHGLTDCFVVLYAGNIGLVQGLETVLETAQILKDEADLRFVFVGDGAGKAGLVEKAKEMNLTNVLFLPYQPQERMSEVYGSGDVCLVSLQKGTGMGALPSKTYSILASGRPMIMAVDSGSEAWDLVERAEAGVCVPPGEAEKLAEAVMKLKDDVDLRKRMGKKGREYVLRYHSPEYAAEQYEALFQAVVNG